MQISRVAAAIVVGVILAAAVVFVAQQTTTAVMPAPLRSHLESERLQIVTSVRGLPLGVRERMQQMFAGGMLDIADPGAPFRHTETADATLPLRRLIVGACAEDGHCLVHYERGGATLTRRVMLHHWTPAETRFEWGATVTDGIASIDTLRQAIVSGAIRGGQNDPW